MSGLNGLVLGTGVSFAKKPEIAREVISSALDFGIYRFDTAPSYKTEGLIGKIVEEELNVRNLQRDKIYIQTKLDAWQMQDGRILKHVDDALRKINVRYLDALLIHWPVPEYMESTWRLMKKAQDIGLVRKIGICNVRMKQLTKYVEWEPDIIQIERHPLNTFEEEVSYCRNHRIEVQAYSPLCKMDSRIKDSERLKAIADKYGKYIGQIVLRWHLDTGVTPIFTTTKKTRVESYSKLYDFVLTQSEIETVSSLNENYKMYLESVACPGF